MTNGVLREGSGIGSKTDSDDTVVLFNLDRLNEECPEEAHRDA